MEKRRSCFGLKTVLWLLMFIGALVFFVVAPWVGNDIKFMAPELSFWFWPGLIYVWAVAIAYYAALYQFYRLINLISCDRSFSAASAARMRAIALIALLAGAWFALGLIGLAAFGLLKPGIFLLMLFLALVCAVISLLARALSRLTARAAEIKAENDLTV